MAGKKGRSGRKKDSTWAKKYLEEAIDRQFVPMMDMAIEMALKGDKDMVKMLLEYRLGRPKIDIDNRLTARIEVTAGDLRESLLKIQEEEQKLLGEVLSSDIIEGECLQIPT